MKKKLGVFLMVLFFCMIGIANATGILYFNDYNVGTDRMAEALLTYSSVTTVASSSAFATQIATGDYDLGIFMVQNSSGYDDGINALGAFVASGGLSIYTDWNRNNTFAGLFGAQWTGGYNSNSIVVTDPALAFGITNPVSLYNPGWGVYSMDVTGNIIAATFGIGGDGAIAIGMSGRSITNGFLTDTFSDGAQGVQLYKNEIDYLLAPVPEPATMLLLGLGLIGLAGVRRKLN